MQNRKRILSVKIKRILDDSPDTSYLGEYSNRPKTDYAIDRAHAEDCASTTEAAKQAQQILIHASAYIDSLDGWPDFQEASNILDSLAEEATDCDCGERGDMERNQYRYFNGCVENYKGESPENIRKYIRQDYERMERLNSGDWCYIGIRAEAKIAIENQHATNLGDGVPYFDSTIQTITSGGIWGTESDSEESYLKELEKEELSDLKTQLRALGFSTRQISQAFKDITEVSE